MKEKILDKIQKALAIAQHEATTPGEAAAAAATVQAMLNAHNLTMDDVAIHAAENEEMQIERIVTTMPTPIWMKVIIGALCETNGCIALVDPGNDSPLICGRETDRTIVVNFFKYFLTASVKLVDKFIDDYEDSIKFIMFKNEHRNTDLEAFLFGYAIEVGKRLLDAHKTSVKSAPRGSETALVFMETRAEKAHEWLTNAVELGEAEPIPRGEIDEYDSYHISMGMEAGAKVAFTDKILGEPVV